MMKIAIALFCCMLLLTGIANAHDHADEGFKWKDLHAVCKGNHESEQCKSMRAEAREFCQANPDKKRCRKLHAMKECKQNPESEKCQEYKERLKPIVRKIRTLKNVCAPKYTKYARISPNLMNA